MSRTISKSSSNDKPAVTFQDPSNCSDRDEPSETTNSVPNSNDNASQSRDESSPVRWFSDGDADGSFATSPQVSPSGVDEQDDQPCDKKIQQIQRLHISKGISILDFFASCDTNWKPTTHYNPEEYLYGSAVPAPSGPESKSTDFYDDTLSPDDTQITKRSGVMITSFSKSMNYLLEQEAIVPDIPESPAVSVVLSSTDSAFSVSADESEIELRDAVDNIVQTLNVTDVTQTDSLADSDSGSVKLSLVLGTKEDKLVDLLVVANRDTTGHQMESVGVLGQKRNESVAARNPTEQSSGERQRGDDPLEYTSAAHGCSGSSQGETVGENHMKSDGVLCTQNQLQSDNNQDPRLKESVIIIEPTEPNQVMHEQSQNRTVVPCRDSVGATRIPSEEDESQLRNESLDRTIVPNYVQNRMKPGKQEPVTDCTLISPSDSLGNDHLRWNDSSTPDSIQAPIGPIGTAKAVVADAAAAPIKLDPITKHMRYTRSSGRKSAQSARKKNVHFKEATPPRKEEVQPCYRTQWSEKIPYEDPYDCRFILDDSGHHLFSNMRSSGSRTAASEEDEDKCDLIKSYLVECSNDFERSMSHKKRATKGKQKRNKKHTQAVQESEYMLVKKDMLRDAVEQAVVSVLQSTKSTESKTTQTDTYVETNDVAVQTPRRYPSGRSRKTSKAKVKPSPNSKQTTLTQYVSRRSPEREPPGNVMSKGSFRKPPPSFTTTPSIELSSVSLSPTIDCENEAPGSINFAEHPGFFRLLDDLRLSPVASINPEADDVCSSQHLGASIITSGEYVCTIRDLHATNAQPKTFTISFNDPDSLPEEEPLCSIAQSLAEKIKSNTLKPLEDMYDAPQNVNTSYIQRLLTQGLDYSLNIPPDEYGSEDDEEIDSGMDETIKPAASFTAIRYRHCSSAKGSQEPQRFSPGCSPIQFSGTPIARDSDRRGSRSPVVSPLRKKGLSERRALN